jgi:hypothetical protein
LVEVDRIGLQKMLKLIFLCPKTQVTMTLHVMFSQQTGEIAACALVMEVV